MKRSIVLVGLLFCLLIPPSTVSAEESNSWEVDLKNGYISTKPIIVEDQVIVRTSGYWTGEDRPHVYAFDLFSGEENWRYRSVSSTNHDMTPLLHIEAGQGSCGSWEEMVIVAWSDGKVTALDIEDGSLIWSSQTEVVTWGITGAMAIDGDNVVVPTRQGLSRFCLDNGVENLRVDLPELGWRNGVTITEESYLIGNEEGILNIISKQGQVSNMSIGDGKIRHSPIETNAGIVIHLQTANGSEIYVGDDLLSVEGYSPAIPLKDGQDIFLGTSSHIIWIDCELICTMEGRTDHHTNGEITKQGENQIWFPYNSPEGGWGVGIPGLEITTAHTDHDTYTTAGPGFGPNGEIALGNDNGVLMVTLFTSEMDAAIDDSSDSKNLDSFIQESLVVFLCLAMLFFQIKKNNKMATKVGLLLLLVIMILILPDISNTWSKEVDKLEEPPSDWDDSWPKEWQGTQVMVFELPDGELAVGGFTGHDTVEDFTDAAAADLDIAMVKESYDFGAWITSFNGHDGEGWEFTIDGKRSSVGISEAELGEDSVVRWSLA
jgi:outer membrane protein assembly factor BamB|tara:strand:+ start:2031 stop:3668 length:1638 start_codon:yes stop_codon:yes gene_type:complete